MSVILVPCLTCGQATDAAYRLCPACLKARTAADRRAAGLDDTCRDAQLLHALGDDLTAARATAHTEQAS